MKERPSWQKYYANTVGKPPNLLLKKALLFVQKKDTALDLGAGALQDVEYLLGVGFKKVVAVDSGAAFAERIEAFNDSRVEGHTCTFDEFQYPKGEYDLVTSQWALPFNSKKIFANTFAKIKASLKPNGIFAGQLFGVRDEWNSGDAKEGITFLSKEKVKDLFQDMKLVSFEEDERDASTASGEEKHWHVFHIIARK